MWLNWMFTYLTFRSGEKTGRSAGVIGLFIGIIILLSIWKWEEWIQPLLDITGITYLFNEIGLINENFLGQTIINIGAFLLILPIILLAPMIIALILIPLIGNSFVLMLLSIILSPIYLIIILLIFILRIIVSILDLVTTTIIRPQYTKENWSSFITGIKTAFRLPIERKLK